MMRRITAFAIGLTFVSYAAHAQTNQDALTRMIVTSANGVLDSMMRTLNDRTLDFNTHIEAINKTRPLEVKNLDSVHIGANVSSTLEFIEYLKQFRASGEKIIHRFEDSLFVLQSEFPPVREKMLIKGVADSYMADNKAFDKYVAALSKIYSQVLNVLLFLQHTPFAIVKGAPQFHSANDVAAYRKMMTQVDQAQAEAAKATVASRKASTFAHKKLQEFNTAETNRTSKP